MTPLYYTAHDLARLFATTPGYVRKVASRNKWGRYRHPEGGVRYRHDHAERDLGQRAEARRNRNNHG